jgi:protein-tyrosine kinase
MERIKQAIEKDKKTSTVKTDRHNHWNNPKAYESFSNATQQELDDVNYTHTSVVKLNAEHLEKYRIIASNKNNAMSMHFDLLRTLVLQKMEEKGWRTLAITSPTPEAGKSVVAINLAMSIAQQTNKTAMLVDFDLRRPKVGHYLGLPMEKSLNDLLDGTSNLSDVLVNPDMPRLVVLATKLPVSKSAETLSSIKIGGLIKELRERYDSRIVIFDLPPVLVTDDAIALLPKIDCILLVVANGMSTKQEIEDSIRLIPAESFIGTVLNKADAEPVSYYY